MLVFSHKSGVVAQAWAGANLNAKSIECHRKLYFAEIMSSYSCSICKIMLNSQSQWDAHVVGIKHQKAQKRDLITQNIAVCKNESTSSTLAITCKSTSPKQLNLVAQTEEYYLGQNGVFMCKLCPAVSVTGFDQLKAHLAGQKHRKAVIHRQGISKLNPCDSTFLPQNSTIRHTRQSSASMPVTGVEQSLVKAWSHKVQCHFDYQQVEELSQDSKLCVLSPHFAFISKDDPIPNMLDYFLK